jgi:predicted amidohydrolase
MITVALLQMASHGAEQAANLAKGDVFCRRARVMGADIALFPEMWNIGYTFFDRADPQSRAAWAARAVGPGDGYIEHFQSLARELDMAIALTYLERWPGRPRNSVSIIDRHGAIALTYAKVHTCEWDVESALTPGDDFRVCDLDTAQGAVRTGAMICYDREFPESARVLMLKGAELILTPNACGLEQHRIGQFMARAYENMLGVAMANYAAPNENGHSIAADGIAFTRDGISRDMRVVEAGEREGIYLAAFDLDALRDYRRREVWGDAYRRPGRYGLLTERGPAEPFARPQATR